MSIRTTSQRLLIRSVHPQEALAYGTVNELRASPQELVEDIAEWYNQRATLLFLILQGYREPSLGALSVAEGTVVGFIKITYNGLVSFRTHPRFRGQGYMKEAVRATFTYFFHYWPHYQFEVKTRSDHAPVIRMMASYGLGNGQAGGWSGVGSLVWRFGRAVFRPIS
ncbi:uncharacterized protein RAG0_02266 [Rhynchosporium agropyri]|uniref:N-acetyltransferase domain-containing protein n=1 Tax=Rhynchosporium agropyri TaxID=914238 RepID=A0A1E1K154_9HELO|nr:uncharacterized protein RAG0_02266 [Rhynchosporium agropyri]